MFIIADKYFVDSLKNIAAENFETHGRRAYNSPIFFECVRHIYEHFEDGFNDKLKSALINVVQQKICKLRLDDKGWSSLLTAFGSNHGFATDVAMAFATTHTGGKTYKCPSCGCIFSVGSGMDEFRCPDVNCDEQGEDDYWWVHEYKPKSA